MYQSHNDASIIRPCIQNNTYFHRMDLLSGLLIWIDKLVSHVHNSLIPQLRTPSHQLELEIGTNAQKPMEEQRCQLFHRGVEFEEHYVCHCGLQYIRQSQCVVQLGHEHLDHGIITENNFGHYHPIPKVIHSLHNLFILKQPMLETFRRQKFQSMFRILHSQIHRFYSTICFIVFILVCCSQRQEKFSHQLEIQADMHTPLWRKEFANCVINSGIQRTLCLSLQYFL